METRLDRLFTLLDTGSTNTIRKSAANQLGLVYKQCPSLLPRILNKISSLIENKSWETRLAAGSAIEAVLTNVNHDVTDKAETNKSDLKIEKLEIKSEATTPTDTDFSESLKHELKSFTKAEHSQGMKQEASVAVTSPLSIFDIRKVLDGGATLLSIGTEFFDQNSSEGDEADRIHRERELLSKTLGSVPGVSDVQFVDDEDLRYQKTQQKRDKTMEKSRMNELIESQINTEGMSVREINTAKRKVKLQLKRSASLQSNGASSSPPVTKQQKLSNAVVEQPGQSNKVLVDTVIDNTEESDVESERDIILRFTQTVLSELFNESWEVRHGSCTCLREIIKHYAKHVYTSTSNSEQLCGDNTLWLEETAVKLICVLALDRFGDYVSDEVVAPVRETSAQCLGILSSHLTTDKVLNVINIMIDMYNNYTDIWSVRYSAVLSFKYILAVRQDMCVELLKLLWILLTEALADSMDDVRAVSASCLLSITDQMIRYIPELHSQKNSDKFINVDEFVVRLWDSLKDLDELTSSTHNIMLLLSSTLTSKSFHSQPYSINEMLIWVDRLIPFMYHSNNSVRKSTFIVLQSLTQKNGSVWGDESKIMDIERILKHIYQRIILEPDIHILTIIEQTWRSIIDKTSIQIFIHSETSALNNVLYLWIYLIMQALSQPIDNNLLIGIQQHEEKTNFNYISGSVSEKPDVMEFKVTNTRIVSSRCCGYLLAHLTNSLVSPQLDIVMTQLNHLFIDNHFSQTVGKFARQRFSAALVVAAWADFCKADSPVFSDLPLINCLLRAAEESIIYNEVTELFTTLQTDCKNFLALLKHHKQPLEHLYPISTIFTVDLAQKLVTTDFLTVKPKLKTLHQNKLSEQADQMLININETRKQFLYQKNRVQCSVAISLISLKHLPPKLNPVIRPLVELIKSDYHHILLEFAGSKLSQVLRSCVSRQPCPNSKVFKNLCASLCSNPERTPNPLTEEHTAADLSELKCTVNDGILSLIILSRESAQVNETGRGRKSEDQNSKKDAASKTDLSCETALLVIMEKLGDNLLNIIPTCEEQYLTPIIKTYDINNATSLTHALQVIEIIYHKLPISIRTTILNQVPSIITCVKNELTVIRHMSARCLAACATVDTSLIMNSAMTSILPLIDTAHNVQYRQGAVETIYRIVDRLGVKCVPYIVLLIVPILGRMTDYDLSVQMMSSLCFASLIKLMPLEGSIPDPDDMNSELKVRRSSERDFLDQLLNGKPLQTYGIPITINTELRKYQQDGVNWLAFLNKYKLHGILCDDMGLGKTLQSVCIIAGDHHMRTEKYQETGSDDCLPLTSLVVCPSTLCAHWVYEVEKFVSRENLRTLNYSTSVSERVKLRERFNNYNLIVASYEIVRNDIDFLKTINWNYCVLDEGHMIKNAKSKTTRAVKQLHCNHRLILTGTPIQNNVLELWSLFDFLMPGYLGTERQFNVKYSRPILQSKDSKSTPKQQEQAALVIESLHKQVLPFLLRRLKTDVLKDLPPKIIQDYYCDLTPLQAQLYDQFSQSSAGKSITQSLTSHDSHMQDQPAVKGHIFQALQYLKKVCNHPALAVNSSHPRYAEITTQLKSEGSSIHDIKHSAKISSLRQLLLDCGIGDKNEDTILNQHRALIFFQHKSMIEIVERDLLHKQMPGVTFMKLDGSVPANNRHLIVKQFNEDPSIDLLLLTTTVGGLGLNLTGADTVIFFEHDWNPMKDLQAMDRAHRIGQTRVVNVYRLITKNTLEEKIMGLQKFKLNIANSVVNEENSNLSSMQTDQLLDLFTIESEQKGSRIPNVPSKGLQSMLQNMTELWDESEYEIEYDVNTFLASLSK